MDGFEKEDGNNPEDADDEECDLIGISGTDGFPEKVDGSRTEKGGESHGNCGDGESGGEIVGPILRGGRGEIEVHLGDADAGPENTGEDVTDKEDGGVGNGIVGIGDTDHPLERASGEADHHEDEEGFVAVPVGKESPDADGGDGADGERNAGELKIKEGKLEAFEGEGGEQVPGESLGGGEDDNEGHDLAEVFVAQGFADDLDHVSEIGLDDFFPGGIGHPIVKEQADHGADPAKAEDDGVANVFIRLSFEHVEESGSDQADNHPGDGRDEGALAEIPSTGTFGDDFPDPLVVDGVDEVLAECGDA